MKPKETRRTDGRTDKTNYLLVRTYLLLTCVINYNFFLYLHTQKTHLLFLLLTYIFTQKSLPQNVVHSYMNVQQFCSGQFLQHFVLVQTCLKATGIYKLHLTTDYNQSSENFIENKY